MGTGYLFETFNALIRRTNAVREDSYLNAPLYYALTGRRMAWVHEGYGATLVVCRHPNVPDRLLVFPEVGDAAGRLAASVISHLQPPANGVQLARFSDADLAQLKNALRNEFNGAVAAIETTDEPVLDWRYPVHILDTARVASLDGAPFARIRNKCRKVEDTTQIMALHDPRALQMMRAARKYWEGSMILRGKNGNGDGDPAGAEGGSGPDFYDALFKMIGEAPERFNGLVFMREGRPVGFTVYDTPFEGTANLLANLTDASVPGMADFQVVATCRAMAAAGIAYMNFGGSEMESLDLFKRKFMPHKTLALRSADVHYRPPAADDRVKSGPLLPFAPA